MRSKIDNDDISNEGMIKVLRNICINISDKSFTKLKFAKTDKMSTKKTKCQEWFDDDCRKAKINVNRKRKLYQEALKNKVPHNESKSLFFYSNRDCDRQIVIMADSMDQLK